MIVVLTEKPSVARDIASQLKATQKCDGYWQGAGYQVTWSYGHLVSLEEPEHYDASLRKWTLEALPIVPPRFQLRVIPDGRLKAQFRIVQKLLRSADKIIGATDAGREGELIFRYILEKAGCGERPFQRLWLSSLTPQAIRQAFASLRPGRDYDPLYHAARCRSEADWLVGMNATRYLTVRYGRRGLLWSHGRVQTPLLALIVNRDDEIRTFQPEPFWELITRYRDVRFQCKEGRFRKEEEARTRLARVDGQPLKILKVSSREFRDQPPQLYDLTELQRDMNRRYGMTAAATLSQVQSLYERKLVTYPRTDSRYLTNDMKLQIPRILEQLRDLKPQAIEQLELDRLRFTGRIVNNAKVSDHHAIIPTGQKPGNLSGPQQKIFDAILTRLIAAFYPPCRKERTVVEAISADVPFEARGVRILDPGWTVLYPRKSDSKKSAGRRGATDASANHRKGERSGERTGGRAGDESQTREENDETAELPAFRVGEQGPHQPEVRKGETSPPKPFTENSLLGAMETAGKLVDDEALKEALKERGLGTPATRAAMIETLLKRNYIQRSGKSLSATDLGRYLVAVITDAQLKSAELTGQWEEELKRIERGAGVADDFMRRIEDYTTKLVDAEQHREVDPSRWGNCPRCQAKIIQGKKGGFGCSNWKSGCSFVFWPDKAGLDHTPEPPEIRQLLQLGRLPSPQTASDGSEYLVVLAPTGRCMQVPVPGQNASTSSKGRGRYSRQRKNSGNQSKSRGKTSGGKSAVRKSSRSGGASGKNASVAIGKCPICNADVLEQPKSFSCSKWREGCSFTIWKTIAGKRISARTARTLLVKGKTSKLKGFKSRAGKSFEAALKLEGEKVELEFD